MINQVDNIPRTVIRVVGHGVSLADTGTGPPVVFIHGNATHAYTWRNIIPYVAMEHRCLAPDLPGMGLSDLILPSGAQSYAFEEQVTHLEMLIELIEPAGQIVLVGHELGATMAAQYARRNPHLVRGIVLIEAALRESNDSLFDTDVRKFLAGVRSEKGDQMVLAENLIIDRYLPRMTARPLRPQELDAFREPYLRRGESRRAMLSMIRQLPLQSGPGPIDALVEAIRQWCGHTDLPKLVIGGSPGFLVTPAVLGTTARWPNTTVASVPGLHFLTEDSPARITSHLIDWLAEIGHTTERRM